MNKVLKSYKSWLQLTSEVFKMYIDSTMHMNNGFIHDEYFPSENSF